MPRTRERVSEVPQRLSPRPPFHLRTSSSSDSDPLHRSPKLSERRSPRSAQSDPLNQKKLGAQSDPLNQKKLGTRVADLESQLGQAQHELKKLKDQLASAECAKKEAQEELEKKKKKPANNPVPDIKGNTVSGLPPTDIQEAREEISDIEDKSSEENSKATDVYEVPVNTELVEPKVELMKPDDESPDVVKFKEDEIKHEEKSSESSENALALLHDEISSLKTKLTEKEEECEHLRVSNESQNTQIIEAAMAVASAQAKEEETACKLKQTGLELEECKANAGRLKQQLEATEAQKSELELEMTKLRVQTEQWRKAADAAAAVLSSGVDMNGRISERCGSMDKQLYGGGYTGFHGSPYNDDLDDVFGGGKKKGSGIRMFGDLWKKKSQK